MAAFARVDGTVGDFDDHRGYGTVRDDDGGRWFFHCSAIADGTRTIDPGAPVSFAIIAGRLGRWEASDVRLRTSGSEAT